MAHRVKVQSGELQALVDQFNRMAGQLQNSHSKLEQKVDVCNRALTEALEQQTATGEILRVITGGLIQPRPRPTTPDAYTRHYPSIRPSIGRHPSTLRSTA